MFFENSTSQPCESQGRYILSINKVKEKGRIVELTRVDKCRPEIGILTTHPRLSMREEDPMKKHQIFVLTKLGEFKDPKHGLCGKWEKSKTQNTILVGNWRN